MMIIRLWTTCENVFQTNMTQTLKTALYYFDDRWVTLVMVVEVEDQSSSHSVDVTLAKREREKRENQKAAAWLRIC